MRNSAGFDDESPNGNFKAGDTGLEITVEPSADKLMSSWLNFPYHLIPNSLYKDRGTGEGCSCFHTRI